MAATMLQSHDEETVCLNPLSAAPHKMVKHTQAIRRIVWVVLATSWGWRLKG